MRFLSLQNGTFLKLTTIKSSIRQWKSHHISLTEGTYWMNRKYLNLVSGTIELEKSSKLKIENKRLKLISDTIFF